MIFINVYQIKLKKEHLYLWKYQSNDKETPTEIDRRHESITVDLKTTPAVAIPKNSDAVVTIDSETPFESRMVPWTDYLWIYKHLVHYSFVEHLIENHDFTPLQIDQNKARINQVYELYREEPIAEPVDGLEIRPGLKIRTRFWNLPKYGPFVGLNFAYTTTNYFTKPLDELLDGATSQNYWLKMNCPSDCPHDECTFHGQSGLIGRFDGFTDTGEACRYVERSDTEFVMLSTAPDGITSNPPAERVTIEPSYPNIRRWAVNQYGPEQSEIIENIDRQRLGLPSHLSDAKLRKKQSNFEQRRLKELVSNVDREFRLITNQPAMLADQPIEVSI